MKCLKCMQFCAAVPCGWPKVIRCTWDGRAGWARWTAAPRCCPTARRRPCPTRCRTVTPPIVPRTRATDTGRDSAVWKPIMWRPASVIGRWKRRPQTDDTTGTQAESLVSVNNTTQSIFRWPEMKEFYKFYKFVFQYPYFITYLAFSRRTFYDQNENCRTISKK